MVGECFYVVDDDVLLVIGLFCMVGDVFGKFVCLLFVLLIVL